MSSAASSIRSFRPADQRTSADEYINTSKVVFHFRAWTSIYDYSIRNQPRCIEVAMPRLLVIGGDETTRTLIESRLADRVSVDCTESVRAGLERHHHQPFDIILWDSVSAPPGCMNP